jgi:hypothetical protein
VLGLATSGFCDRESEVSIIHRFGFGGLGGLVPVIASLAAIDIVAFAALIDNHTISEGLCIGYTIRVLGLFALGGIMACVNTEVRNPWALVQIGIAAPALVTSYLSGAALNRQPERIEPKAALIIGTAYAGELSEPNRIILAGGFLSDLLDGIVPGLGVQQDDLHQKGRRALSQVLTKPDVDFLLKEHGPIRVRNTETKGCLPIPEENRQSREQLESLLKDFPPPTFVIEPGTC